MAWHTVDRLALADALAAAGPGAPTLCEGWRTEHLAAHVHLRETRTTAVAGVAVPALADRTERITRGYGDDAVREGRWEELVGKVRQGPPRWHPLSLLGDTAQLAELYVHAEDVRRGGPDGADVPARALEPGHREGLWRSLGPAARMFLRDAPRQLVLVGEDGRRHPGGPRQAPGGAVEVRGPVTELVLYAFGRARVAHVELDGAPDDVTAVRIWRPVAGPRSGD